MTNKEMLRQQERQKYGKWASNKIDRPRADIYRPVENEEDIGHLRNAMAKGNYPVPITDCEVVGINGDCGYDCPVYGLRGSGPGRSRKKGDVN